MQKSIVSSTSQSSQSRRSPSILLRESKTAPPAFGESELFSAPLSAALVGTGASPASRSPSVSPADVSLSPPPPPPIASGASPSVVPPPPPPIASGASPSVVPPPSPPPIASGASPSVVPPPPPPIASGASPSVVPPPPPPIASGASPSVVPPPPPPIASGASPSVVPPPPPPPPPPPLLPEQMRPLLHKRPLPSKPPVRPKPSLAAASVPKGLQEALRQGVTLKKVEVPPSHAKGTDVHQVVLETLISDPSRVSLENKRSAMTKTLKEWHDSKKLTVSMPELEQIVTTHIASINSEEEERVLYNQFCTANLKDEHTSLVQHAKTADLSAHSGALQSSVAKKTTPAIEVAPLSVRTARLLVRQMLEKLVKVHEEGYAHRHIDPDAFCVDKERQVHLIDFSRAKKTSEGPSALKEDVSGDHNNDKEQAASFLDYSMSEAGYGGPENITHNVQDERPSDIWALGVTLSQVLLGQQESLLITGTKSLTMNPSVDGHVTPKEYLDTLQKKRDETITQLRTLTRGKKRLVDLIEQMLTMNPSERPTASELLNIGPFPKKALW